MAQPVASIDIGTNSTRLLVAETGPGTGLRTLERLMRITRLGEQVEATRKLSTSAIERTVDTLRDYRDVIDAHGIPAERIRMAATSASRDASNRDDFFDAAETAIGVRPELLSGTEEAELSFLGATADLDPSSGPFLVIDLGGGSTEFVLGTTDPDPAVWDSLSLDFGCVRLTEQYLHADPPAAEELYTAISYTDSWLDDLFRLMPRWTEARTIVGLAGTISTVTAVEIGLATYDRDRIHGFVLEKAAVEDVFRTLATERLEDRLHNPGLEPERADVIVGGTCALVAIYRRLALPEILVSEADILDGLARSITTG